MYQRTITKATLAAFHRHLQEAERRPATIAKYLREVQDFVPGTWNRGSRWRRKPSWPGRPPWPGATPPARSTASWRP